MPKVADLKISDDELRESIETNQLRLMKERGSDLTIFSPRASFMAHHIGDFEVSQHLGRDLQRAVLPRRAAVPRPLHARGDAAAEPGRRPDDLHPRAGEVRRAVRQRRHQPEPRSLGRPLDQPAADRPPLVPHLREDGRVRHPGDDPRQHQLQRLLPHHRRALPERRHHGLHAVPDPGRPVQGLPDAEVPDSARRRRGALPLGALPRPGAGDEEAAADRSTC